MSERGDRPFDQLTGQCSRLVALAADHRVRAIIMEQDLNKVENLYDTVAK